MVQIGAVDLNRGGANAGTGGSEIEFYRHGLARSQGHRKHRQVLQRVVRARPDSQADLGDQQSAESGIAHHEQLGTNGEALIKRAEVDCSWLDHKFGIGAYARQAHQQLRVIRVVAGQANQIAVSADHPGRRIGHIHLSGRTGVDRRHRLLDQVELAASREQGHAADGQGASAQVLDRERQLADLAQLHFTKVDTLRRNRHHGRVKSRSKEVDERRTLGIVTLDAQHIQVHIRRARRVAGVHLQGLPRVEHPRTHLTASVEDEGAAAVLKSHGSDRQSLAPIVSQHDRHAGLPIDEDLAEVDRIGHHGQ